MAAIAIDSSTMLRRDLQHAIRFPMLTISALLTPTIMMLLFVYVFGNAMSAVTGHGDYVNFLVPGILVMAIGSSCASTAVTVNIDMNEGIISRFRTMPIARSSVLIGQVAGALIRTALSLTLVVCVGLLAGFRPSADFLGFVAFAAVTLMIVFAMTWLALAFGMATRTPGGANSTTLPLQFLPFISSAFLPPSAMSGGPAWFAAHQPFTPMIDTIRGLLTGGPVAQALPWAIGWCVAFTLVGYLWSLRLYNRDISR
ncbi:ABC transporter permease [Labedaea rhizosphaerae]|uniref:Transport permease protein n=1 Tax=Labedaea rhizosphaerae TaxID=598644 RepID=A0A4R6S3A8_LABRH|nr:ABC transporter permease [Labedaea rhizosphaerae]TDP94102.1 ABC-2 type transport system permease protein [Labedaea rhizosphaerae]